MYKIAFFDTKSYDKNAFLKYSEDKFEIKFFDNKLNDDTVSLANGCNAVCVFVNDNINKSVIDKLVSYNIKLIALRCAGYNNVDLKYAKDKINIVRVPAYSPYAIAEHTIGLILLLNRKIHRAYIRTRDHNFSLEGLVGFDLKNKTVGIIGTGKIGCCFANICKGLGMNIIGNDPYPTENFCGEYKDLDFILENSNIISLHCPLTKENKNLICKKNIDKMKKGVYIINTSRGGLVNTDDLIEGIKSGVIGAAGLDVYEEETEIFFEDFSDEIIHDDTLSTLISMPNVIVTSHQAFLTREALDAIAKTTIDNIQNYLINNKLENSVII